MSGAAGETRLAAAALLRTALRGEGRPAGPRLLVRGEGGAVREVDLVDGLTLGRGPEAALRLADAGVSRRHARVRLLGGGAAAVEDLGSKNGLQLNGRWVGPGAVALGPGDELTVGSTRIRLIDPSAELPAGAAAPPQGDGRPGPATATPACARGVGSRRLALASAGLLLAAVAAALFDAALRGGT